MEDSKLSINPFNRGNPMTLKDAAVVSTISAVAIWILNFFASVSVGQIRADPAAFVLECVKTFAVAWAGNFVTLAGLEQLVKRRDET